MTEDSNSKILEEILERIELPQNAYETARRRYEDLGEWLGREGSSLEFNDVHVFAQGSFRLGTAIKPFHEHEEYDLDLACKIREGFSKYTHSQFDLKEAVRKELELYRTARKIEKELDEKHRCWTIEYKDQLSFHMDVVPALPLDEEHRSVINESIMKLKMMDEQISNSVSEEALSITDDRNKNYEKVDAEDWNISNPEGYAKWFESRMIDNEPKIVLEHAQVDKVPTFLQKTTLQKVIQLLKRHRDSMYQNQQINECKPISVIITTLATHAYNGEANLVKALSHVLNNMGKYVKQTEPRIQNPVNPKEDFADKWSMKKYNHLQLEENFWTWLEQAKMDFKSISNTGDSSSLSTIINESFTLNMSKESLKEKLGIPPIPVIVEAKNYDIDKSNIAKPWKNI